MCVLRWCAKKGCALIDNLFAVSLGSPCQSAIEVTVEIATKMARDFTNSFELVFALFQLDKELTGVFHHAG
jgi:hypothetical protein